MNLNLKHELTLDKYFMFYTVCSNESLNVYGCVFCVCGRGGWVCVLQTEVGSFGIMNGDPKREMGDHEREKWDMKLGAMEYMHMNIIMKSTICVVVFHHLRPGSHKLIVIQLSQPAVVVLVETKCNCSRLCRPYALCQDSSAWPLMWKSSHRQYISIGA